jgi:glycosyltransferase involved in cell wall biosynthesis
MFSGFMRLALSLLCENPKQRTGHTSQFRELITRSVNFYPDVEWIVFAGKGFRLSGDHERVKYVDCFPGNDQLKGRLFADHFLVSSKARKMQAKALVTVGFVPILSVLPVAMHVLTLHHLSNSNQISSITRAYRRFVVHNGIKRARLIITNSEFAAQQIRISSPVDEKKLLICNEGLDHSVFHPQAVDRESADLESALGIKPGYIAWVSNLYPYKQATKLVEAFAALPEALRVRHPLVFVGADWNGQRALTEQLAADLGILENIRFLGWVDEKWIAPFYRQASAHVLASREETWGRSVTEAMSCGCPCIVNDIPVMHEVTQGKALIVNFDDKAATLDGLTRLLTDEPLRQKLRKEGVERTQSLSFDRATRERMERILQIAS